MTLSDLLGRVEGAGGPDRELDADLHRYVTGVSAKAAVLWDDVPDYMGSIDAAFAFAHRLRPIGIMTSHELNHCLARDGEEYWNFRIKRYSHDEGEEPEVQWGTAWTASAAIVICVLRALIQLETQGTE